MTWLKVLPGFNMKTNLQNITSTDLDWALMEVIAVESHLGDGSAGTVITVQSFSGSNYKGMDKQLTFKLSKQFAVFLFRCYSLFLSRAWVAVSLWIRRSTNFK